MPFHLLTLLVLIHRMSPGGIHPQLEFLFRTNA